VFVRHEKTREGTLRRVDEGATWRWKGEGWGSSLGMMVRDGPCLYLATGSWIAEGVTGRCVDDVHDEVVFRLREDQDRLVFAVVHAELRLRVRTCREPALPDERAFLDGPRLDGDCRSIPREHEDVGTLGAPTAHHIGARSAFEAHVPDGVRVGVVVNASEDGARLVVHDDLAVGGPDREAPGHPQ